jgi:hypothetical protein
MVSSEIFEIECIKSFFKLFDQGKSYEFKIEKHSETGIIVYQIISNGNTYFPMTSQYFCEYFDFKQFQRNIKIEEILK